MTRQRDSREHCALPKRLLNMTDFDGASTELRAMRALSVRAAA